LAQNSGHSVPLFFFRNTGVTNSEIRFIVETPELRAGFRNDSVTFQLPGLSAELKFAGANANVRIDPAEPLPGTANFLIGEDASRWSTGNATYRKIVYRDLYPGIDMNYSGSASRIKSEFIIAPEADPNRIRLEYAGVDHVQIGANGDMIVSAQAGELREAAPEIYQDTPTGRVKIQGRYHVLSDRTVGFEIGDYDRSKPLVIDPTITYSTYLGGSGIGAVTGVAVDSSDNLYVTGWTESLNFPIVGAEQPQNQGSVNAFVVKLDAAGTALIYATYIGGNSDDRASAIAVDAAGEAYVTGSTTSTSFPKVLSLRSTLDGGRDAFVLKLNATGNTLLYSTLLGGASEDWGTAIALDASGNAYIAGDTLSTDFPVTTGAAQPANGGQQDAFVTKLSTSAALIYSTYLGGAANEHSGGIAVDGSDSAYVAGGTFSTNFPTTGVLQQTNHGGQNAFATKISASGAIFVYSTYLGGTGGTLASPEQANAIAVDGSGNAYLAGVTNSANFPVTASAFQAQYGGAQDAFVTKINAAGNSIPYSTYLGGSSFDWASGIAVDASGNAYVSGYTSSFDFPVISGVQAGFNGLYDAFVAELNAAGNGLTFSTYYGGSGADQGAAIALDANANIFTGGQTASLNLPLTTPIQPSNVGGSTGWVARMGVTAPPAQLPAVVSVSPASGNGNTATFTAQFSDTAGATALVNVALLVNVSASTSFACYVSYSLSQNQFTLENDVPSTGGSPVIPGGGSAQNDQCALLGSGSSVTLSGTLLTMTVSLAFQNGFAGNQTVYLYAQDANVNTGWIAKGTFGVTAAPAQPFNVSVSPNGNTGSSQTFQFVFSDSQNPANLTATAMDFGRSSSTLTNSCFIVYDALEATVQLEYDNLEGSNTKPITSTAVISNAQCAIGAASATVSGLSIIVTLNITFSAAYSGLENIFMYASDLSGASTGWQQMGTYTVATGGIPAANSVVPSSGSGPGQRFSVQVSDAGGSSFITDIAVLFSSSVNTTNACFIIYDSIRNTLQVDYDNPANGSTTLTLGSAGTASNSQCLLNSGNSTVVFGTTAVVLTLDLTFTSAFSGPQNVYVFGAEANSNTGWVQLGTWTVTGGVPTAVSVTPASGTGSSLATYVFATADSSAGTNISSVGARFTAGAPANVANSCYVVFNVPTSEVGLYANDGVTLGVKPVGSSANLFNSQCAVGFTAFATSGTGAQFTVEIEFFPAVFAGPKTVYLEANEPAATSGWVSVGTWTVQ
jgi:Beta-propeller repeat